MGAHARNPVSGEQVPRARRPGAFADGAGRPAGVSPSETPRVRLRSASRHGKRSRVEGEGKYVFRLDSELARLWRYHRDFTYVSHGSILSRSCSPLLLLLLLLVLLLMAFVVLSLCSAVRRERCVQHACSSSALPRSTSPPRKQTRWASRRVRRPKR